MNTMQRCPTGLAGQATLSIAICALCVSAGLFFSSTAHAQATQEQAPTLRPFPANALRGELQVTDPPNVLLNGKADRLAPGARIRSQQNMFVVSGAIIGQAYAVNYTREASGLLRDVWILTPEEAAVKRPTASGAIGVTIQLK
jgi:hypothetical protein